MQLCQVYKTSPIRVIYHLYCDPYAKCEYPSFNYFNSIKALTNEILLKNWFFTLPSFCWLEIFNLLITH